MPVPGATANYLKNTTGGAFSAQTQGGTILSNQTTGDAITKALALKDNAADFTDIPTPKKSATTGSYGTEVVNAQGSNGTLIFITTVCNFEAATFWVRRAANFGSVLGRGAA